MEREEDILEKKTFRSGNDQLLGYILGKVNGVSVGHCPQSNVKSYSVITWSDDWDKAASLTKIYYIFI